MNFASISNDIFLIELSLQGIDEFVSLNPLTIFTVLSLLNVIIMKEISELYNHLKSSAKSRNIDFSLTKSELHDLSFPITCPILGLTLTWNKGSAKDNSYSIDRVDSSKGYSIDNIIVISNRANILKRDATLTELKLITEFYTQLNPQEI